MIEQARKAPVPSLLLENGDFLQGSFLSDAFAEGTAKGPHPVVSVMNHLQYDAAALGNHEFNLALPRLRDAMETTDFPVLCANLVPTSSRASIEYSGLWRQNTLLNVDLVAGGEVRKSLKVGLFGVLPPQTVEWDSLRIGGRLTARGIVETAREQVRELKSKGADIIVALGHTGISIEPLKERSENAALYLAALQDLDVVICGHTHKVFPGAKHPCHPDIDATRGTLCGKPAVMPGAVGSHLGIIDLALEIDESGFFVADHHVSVLAAIGGDAGEDFEESTGVTSLLAEAQADAVSRASEVIGTLPQPLNTYFSMVSDCAAERVVAEAKLTFLEDALSQGPLKDMPVLASVAPMKCGGRLGAKNYADIPAGPVAVRALAEMQPYLNHISLVRCKGENLVEWLEMSASLYNQLLPGVPQQRLFEREAQYYNREAIYGLSYALDLTQPARYRIGGEIADFEARRVQDVRWRGQLLDHKQEFLLATNDYRTGGGGVFPGIHSERVVAGPIAGMRQILAKYLSGSRRQKSNPVPTWRFAKMPGVVATFESGQQAVVSGHTSALPENVTALGATTCGFMQFQIDLGASG